LESDGQLFEEKLSATKDARAIRVAKTLESVEKGNELYSFCRIYSTIGKLIWQNSNPARYNSYLIYKKHAKKKEKVENPQ
jgi:hypothetical protein